MKVLPAQGVVRGHAPAASSAHTGGAFKTQSPCASFCVLPLGTWRRAPMHTQDTYDTKHTQNRNRGYRLGLPQRVQVPPLGPLKVWRASFWLMMRVLIDWFCVKDATCSPSPSVHAQLRQGQRDIPWAPGRCAAREGRRGQDIPAAPPPQARAQKGSERRGGGERGEGGTVVTFSWRPALLRTSLALSSTMV